MKETYRCRCPICGMMPEISRVAGEPYKFKLFLQRFGGKAFGHKGKNIGRGKGSSPGFMKYEDITDIDKSLAGEVKSKIMSKIESLAPKK